LIQSFANKDIGAFFFDDKTPRGAGWTNVRKVVRRKLAAIDSAHVLEDLRVPPGNQLEALKSNLAGYYSIRVNDQWRVIFRWPATSEGPSDVDVLDYH
jgi:proteic killer suppression protein